MSSESKNLRDLFEKYLDILNTDPDLYAKRKVRLSFPYINKNILNTILQKTKQAFEKDANVIQLTPPFYVVGDLHGHFLDLIRIFRFGGIPPITKYLFLGDFIDRGEFSLETIIMIFLLKIYFPANIFVVRGNHEFYDVCKVATFACELGSYFSEDVLSLFIDVFAYMPLAAVVHNLAVFLHGGIGPSFQTMDQINSIVRPIFDFSDKIVADIVWSDPSENIDEFAPSSRGIGSVYGHIAICDFLKRNNFHVLVRGHQTLMSGCAFSLDNKVVTIYSASNECGVNNNNSGIALVTREGKIDFNVFGPMPHLIRSEAKFLYCDMNGKITLRTLLDFGINSDRPSKKILTPFLQNNRTHSVRSRHKKDCTTPQITRVVLRGQKSVLAESLTRRQSAPK